MNIEKTEVKDSLDATESYLEDAARLGRELVERATAPAHLLLADQDHHISLASELDDGSELVGEVVAEFINELPGATSSRFTIYGERPTVARRPIVTESLEEAVLLRSILWDNDGALYYQIGLQVDPSTNDGSDVLARLLLYPADPLDKLVVATVSAQKLELMNDAARTSLSEPIDTPSKLEPFQYSEGGFKVPAPIKRIVSEDEQPKLMGSPSTRKLERVRSKVSRDGIAGCMSTPGGVNLEDCKKFNIPFYALKLAVELGRKDAFNSSFDRLEAPNN